MVLIIPLSLFWVDSSPTRIYTSRHIKTISYQIGLFLIIAFFIEYIVLTYNSYVVDAGDTTEDKNKRLVDTFREILSEIESSGPEAF